VAKAIPFSRRREVSFAHHEAVADLRPEEQDALPGASRGRRTDAGEISARSARLFLWARAPMLGALQRRTEVSMRWIHALALSLRSLFRRARVEDELDAEQ